MQYLWRTSPAVSKILNHPLSAVRALPPQSEQDASMNTDAAPENKDRLSSTRNTTRRHLLLQQLPRFVPALICERQLGQSLEHPFDCLWSDVMVFTQYSMIEFRYHRPCTNRSSMNNRVVNDVFSFQIEYRLPEVPSARVHSCPDPRETRFNRLRDV
jgi:hypothetical protein